ncbi:MAG: type IV secretion protein Rhs, partial [Rhizobacter sp.]|nr:type IV secretion protein Rhs [Rhizobacter sp.]
MRSTSGRRWDAVWLVVLSGLASAGAVTGAAAQTTRVDPAPVNEEVVQRLARQRVGTPDALPQLLQRRLDESGTLLREITRGDADDAGSRRARVAALAQQIESLRSEARVRMAASRERLQSLGLTDKLSEWDALSARVEQRFDGMRRSLDAVRAAGPAQARLRAAQALAELDTLQLAAAGRDRTEMPVTQPNWRSQKTQPTSELRRSPRLPSYLSYEASDRLYAFDGNTMLAAAPPALPGSATNCGSPAELAASLAETQDVRITPEIRALAERLGYSPAKILRHVYEHVAFEPYYGSLKGSVGTLVAGAGGATDQASLLIALLRASNIPARYVKAQVRLTDPTPDPLGGRVARWLGAKSYAGAAAMLGQGQNPSVITINNASAQAVGVSFTHVWAEACVPYSHYRGMQHSTAGSRWIPLEPSFKDASYQAGMALNVSFDYAGFLARRTHLLPDEYFAQQVQQAIRAGNANAALADVAYTGRINPLLIDVLPASTPFEVDNFLAWDGGSSPEAAELPDSHRLKLNVAVASATGSPLLSHTLSLPQTALNRLTLAFRGATPSDQSAFSAWQNNGSLSTPLPCAVNVVPVLRGGQANAEGVELAAGPSASPLGVCSTDNQLTMSVTLAELVNPTLNSVSFDNIHAANYHALQAYAFQASDRLLGERATTLLASVRNIGAPNTALDETEGEFLHLVGLKYMRYISDSSRRIGQLDGGSGDVGNHLGLTASQMKVLYLFDVPYAVARTGFLIDVPGGRSRSVDLTSGDLVWKTFLLSGYSSSAFEYYVWQENVRMDAVSTTRGMQFASEAGIPLLTANSANWTAIAATIAANPGCSLSPTNLNYPQCWLDSIKTNYIDQGFTVTLPRSLIQYGGWRGSVYVTALDNTASTTGLESVAGFIINGGSGGYTVDNAAAPLNTYNPGSGAGYHTPDPSRPQPVNNAGLNNGFDARHTVIDGDVNVATGNVFRTERDFSAKGRGGLPLVFERAYNSRNPQPGPFGYGWTHSFNQFLSFKDDNGNGATDAGDNDGLTSSVGWTDGTGGEKLFGVSGTAAGVAIGSNFVRMPGSFATMARNPDGSYTVREKNGMVYRFESLAGTTATRARLLSIQDRNGNTLTLGYSAACGQRLCTVTDPVGRAVTLGYDSNGHITQMTDWASRTFRYGYTDGHLTSYSNPRAVAGLQQPTTYAYYGAADGPNLNHVLKEMKLPRGNGLRYEYYATGRLFRRTDGMGHTRTYTYNDFRRETLQINERGHTRRYDVDPFGNTVQIVEENGATHLFGYDTAVPANVHNRVSKQDPQGLVTAYAFDGNGNVTQIVNPSGSTELYSHHTAFNLPAKVKDANGHYAVMKYDTRGNLVHEIRLRKSYCLANDCAALDPVAYSPAANDMVAWRVMGYDTHGNITSRKHVRDFAAQVATNTALSTTGPIMAIGYDANGLYPVSSSRTGRKNSDTSPSTQSASVVFDTLGRVRTGIDADWQPTQYAYDDADRMTQRSDATGRLRTLRYDDNNNLLGERLDVDGVLADSRSSSYDLNDRRLTQVDAGGNISRLDYDAAGNVVQLTTPDLQVHSFEYDPANRLLRKFDPEFNAITRTLDARGRPRSISNANQSVGRYEYHDALQDGRLKSTIDPLGRRNELSFDANGNVTSSTVVGSGGITTRNTLTFYDELNRPTRVVGPGYLDATLGNIRPVIRYSYDNLGRLSQLAAGRTTDLSGQNLALDVVAVQNSFVHDDFGRKVRDADGLNRAWLYSYDGQNNPVSSIDPRGQTTTYAWNHGHQLASVLDHAGNQHQYTRNALGQVTLAQSPAVAYTYVYDAAHRLRRVTDSRAGKTLTYTRSPGGLLNSMVDSDGNRTDYDYDANGRLAGLWAPNGDYAAFAYDAGGRMTDKWLAGAAGGLVSARYGYHADNTLASLSNLVGATIVSSHTYGYDTLGNRSTHTERIGATTVNYVYGYDALNRLSSVDNGTAAQLESFGYDPLGNRTRRQTGSAAAIHALYDAANQLTELHSGSTTGPLLASLGYDDAGNLVSRSDTGLALAYDALNRLNQATLGGQVSQYAYDDQGRRVQKTVGGNSTQFLYDGLHVVAEYGAGWGTPASQYVHGEVIDSNLIRIPASGSSQYLHQDGLMSVVAVTNSAGSTDASQRFDAWGQRIASSGLVGRYGFTGREPDETGLVYHRARYLDPSLGRFTQRDPVGVNGGLHAYAYVGNSPQNATDPSGNTPMHVGAAIVGGIGGLLFQAGMDLASGRMSSLGDYAGA